jgi:hypothetical protein
MVPASPQPTAEDVAGALLSVLTDSRHYGEAADVTEQYTRHLTRESRVPEALMECWVRLAAQSPEIGAVNTSAKALVTSSCFSVRAWSLLAASDVLARVPAVTQCVADTLLDVHGERACGTEVQRSLRLLSAESLAVSVNLAGRVRTPLAVAVCCCFTKLRELQAQPESNASGAVGECLKATCESLCAVFRALHESCWLYVSDDEFAQIIGVLRSSSACRHSGDVLQSESFLARLRTGFARGTVATGRVYGILSCGDTSDCALASDAVANWPSLFGATPAFKYGYLIWRVEERGTELCDRLCITEVEQLAAYYAGGLMSDGDVELLAQERRWFEAASNAADATGEAENGKLLATAYLIAPQVFRGYMQSTPQPVQKAVESITCIREVLDIPLSVPSAIDETVDGFLANLLGEVSEVGDDLRALGFTSDDSPSQIPSSEGETRTRIDANTLRLRRLALSQPMLLLRRANALCGAVLAVLSVGNPGGLRSILVATGILRVLLVLQSSESWDSKFGDNIWECASKCVHLALGESRAANGVRSEFASLGHVACDLLGSLLASPSVHRRKHRIAFKEDRALRTLLRSAERTESTDSSLRIAIEKLLVMQQSSKQ